MFNDVTVFNIREYLSGEDNTDLGEEELRKLLSEFSCGKNPDVERFLKQQSIEFTKKQQSVTYLVFLNADTALYSSYKANYGKGGEFQQYNAAQDCKSGRVG